MFVSEKVWILCYVDDLVVIGSDITVVESSKSKTSLHLDVKDLGKLQQFLGIIMRFEKGHMSLSQSSCISKVLQKFGMSNCKAVSKTMSLNLFPIVNTSDPAVDRVNYQELVGSVLYISIRTRPDISYAASKLTKKLFRAMPVSSHCCKACTSVPERHLIISSFYKTRGCVIVLFC